MRDEQEIGATKGSSFFHFYFFLYIYKYNAAHHLTFTICKYTTDVSAFYLFINYSIFYFVYLFSYLKGATIVLLTVNKKEHTHTKADYNVQERPKKMIELVYSIYIND